MKICPTCGQVFSLQDLLSNPLLVPIGMTSDEEAGPDTFYYFTHDAPGCGTTFTVHAEAFRSAIQETIPATSNRGHGTCPCHCSRIGELQFCHNECHWAPYRRLLLDMLARRNMARPQTQ